MLDCLEAFFRFGLDANFLYLIEHPFVFLLLPRRYASRDVSAITTCFNLAKIRISNLSSVDLGVNLDLRCAAPFTCKDILNTLLLRIIHSSIQTVLPTRWNSNSLSRREQGLIDRRCDFAIKFTVKSLAFITT